MKAEPLKVAAWELVTGDRRPEGLPALAADALARGVDSPTLGELAAQSASDVRGSRDLFSQVINELGLKLLDPDPARWNLVRKTARAIVATEVAPEVGARQIWRWELDVRHSPGRPPRHATAGQSPLERLFYH